MSIFPEHFRRAVNGINVEVNILNLSLITIRIDWAHKCSHMVPQSI